MNKHSILFLAFLISIAVFPSAGLAGDAPVYKLDVPFEFKNLDPVVKYVRVCACSNDAANMVGNWFEIEGPYVDMDSKAGIDVWDWDCFTMAVPPDGNLSGSHFFKFTTPTKWDGSYNNLIPTEPQHYWHTWFQLSPNGELWCFPDKNSDGFKWAQPKPGAALNALVTDTWQS